MLKAKSSKKIYFTDAQTRLYLVSPRWYMGIMSRGTGKTTVIQALRSYLTAKNIPGGLSVFYNATYIGAQQRTVANSLAGWNNLGLVEGRDYVKNIKPPKHFSENKAYTPLNWKNTIVYKNGHVFIIASNDRPGLVNSLSITGGIFVDEFRFINEPLMREDLYPAIRGKNIWGEYNPYVFSRTYTSDMPKLMDDSEWAFDLAKKMNPEQIVLIAQASIKVEKLKYKIHLRELDYHKADRYTTKQLILNKIYSLKKTLVPKQRALDKIRSFYKGQKGSVYYDTGSFIANLNVLGKDYFFDNADPKNALVARTSYLNIKPEEVENKFYSNLSKKHFIQGKFNYDIIDEFGIPDASGKMQLQANHILDYDPMRAVDVEFDFGDMCTCSVSQTFGLEERYIATFEVLIPFSIDDLVVIVNDFLKHHITKRINVYKDPSGNYMKNKKKQTFGVQTVLMFKSLGWNVTDRCPYGSMNPSHDAKHQLINDILREKKAGYPFVRIIRETNQQLESSLNKAPRILKIRSDGSKEILKDKSSERELALEDKPMKSTDHSDHFDIKLWHKYNKLMPGSSIFL